MIMIHAYIIISILYFPQYVLFYGIISFRFILAYMSCLKWLKKCRCIRGMGMCIEEGHNWYGFLAKIFVYVIEAT